MSRIDQILDLIDEVIDVGDQHTLEPPVDPEWQDPFATYVERVTGEPLAPYQRRIIDGIFDNLDAWDDPPTARATVLERDRIMAWWLAQAQTRRTDQAARFTILTTSA